MKNINSEKKTAFDINREVKKYGKKRKGHVTWKKIVMSLACMVVFITTYMLILPAITLTAKPDPTADVESEADWEEMFKDLKLSGNYAADLLTVAKTQIGYTESTKNFIYDGSSASAGSPEDIAQVSEVSEDNAALTSSADVTKEISSETAASESEAVTEAPTEPATEAPTEPATEASPEMGGVAEGDGGVTSDETETSYTKENKEEPEGETETKISETESETETIDTETDYGDTGSILGYSRYGAWYGIPYGHWCAMFISFCLNYAEVPTDVFPIDAGCQNWINKVSTDEYNYYHSADSGYVPSAGDLIFFDWYNNNYSDHIGIVVGLSEESASSLSAEDREEILDDSIDALINGTGADDSTDDTDIDDADSENNSNYITVVTLEGNSSDMVTTRAYSLDYSCIMGYAEMPGYTYDGLSNALSLLLEDVNGYSDAAESSDDLISLCEEGRGRLLSMDNASLALYEEESITDEEFASLEELSDSVDAELTSLENQAGGVSDEPASLENISDSFSDEPVSSDAELYSAAVTASNYTDTAVFSQNRTEITKNYELQTGDSYTITITGVSGASWSVSNTSGTVASASLNGNTVTVTALSEGSATITLTATVNRTTYILIINVSVADFNLQETFTSYRYYHLDVKVDADFTIYFYDENTGSLSSEKPENITVESVSAKIYNTSSLEGTQTYNKNASAWAESDMSGTSTPYENYTTYTYNDQTVTGYDVIFQTDSSEDENDSSAEFKSVGGHGSGGSAPSSNLVYYDGDTVVLTVTISYSWRGTTYTRTMELTYTVCEYFNVCDSKSNTGDMRGFDILAEAEDITEIAATKIQKVDQYGNPLEGVIFALYSCDQSGNYYYVIDQQGSGGEVIYADLSGASYEIDSDTGVISDISGALYYTQNDNGAFAKYDQTVSGATITPQIVAKTDSDGYFTFLYPEGSDEAGKSMTMNDLKTVYGEYFILREIYTPDGYRATSEEMRMHITGTGTTLLLECENNIESGVTTEPIIMVMATKDYLVKADPTGKYADDENGTSWTEQEGHKINYIETNEDSSISINGTLFVVILKKGSRDPEIETIDTWYPVYGDDEDGYTILNYEEWYEGDSEDTYVKQLSAAIYAAKQQLALNGGSTDGLVFAIGESGNVTLTITSLPGSVKEYYNYIQKINAADSDPANDSIEALRAESEYFAGYYYTTADSLEDATVENTTRVMSRSGLTEDYGGFTIVWGSNVNVTNYESVIYFQKVDDGRNFVNGAVFALYKAGEDSEGKLYYIADENGTAIYLGEDTSGTGEGEAVAGGAAGSYKVNSETGVITVTVPNGDGKSSLYTITPTQVGTTATVAGEDGTGSFSKLSGGYYVMREVFAPDPFVLNTTEVKIYVGSDGTYANAGEADDGVIVGCDPGYLSESFSGFASEGDIDQTLSYIYTTLMLNYSDTFAELVGSLDTGWSFVSPGSETAGAGEKVDSISEAIVTYLEYSYSGENALFNYVANSNQNARSAAGKAGSATLSGQGSRRLWTDENWAKLAIYQDYAYGKDTAGNASYEDLTSYGDISHLYDPSVYIRVTDDVAVDIEIDKVSAQDTSRYLTGAEFYLYYEETGVGDDGSTVTSRYYYSYTESGSVDGEGTVRWIAATSTTDSDGKTVWIVPEGATKLSTSSAGTDDEGNETTVYSAIHVYGLTSALSSVYWLEECTAPDGYQLLDSPVKINVNGATVTIEYGDNEYTLGTTENTGDTSGWSVGKTYVEAKGLTAFEDGVTYYTYDSETGTYNKVEDGAEFDSNVTYYVRDDYTWVITVPNSDGYALPNAGGMGTKLLYALGFMMVLGAGVVLVVRRRMKASE